MPRRNGIWYDGRMVNNRSQARLSRAKTGRLVLDLVVAEQFQDKNGAAPDQYKDATKGPDDYVNTTTAWHRIRIFGTEEQLKPLVTNPLFNHGAVVEVDCSYKEEEPWEDRAGIRHAGRREQIFLGSEDGGTIGIKAWNDKPLGARDEWAKPLWDGSSDLPALGGGGPKAPEYAENEGF